MAELTGLRLDPYFTATKLTWLAENEPAPPGPEWRTAVAVGTVDSYLIARLTGGGRHVTDASNASRTLLFDIAGRAVVGGAVLAVRRAAARAARGGAVYRDRSGHRPGRVPRAGGTDRRDSR